jgi:hypothetical protein
MDISNINQYVDSLMINNKHKMKSSKFISDINNLSKITKNQILNSQICKNVKNTTVKKTTSSSIEIVENISNFPYTIDETVYDDKDYSSIRIKIKYYKYGKVPTIKFLNKYSYLRSQHNLIILI